MQTDRNTHRRGHVSVVALLALGVAAGVYASVGAGHKASRPRRVGSVGASATIASAVGSRKASARPAQSVPPLRVNVPRHAGTAWTATALVRGVPAAWLAQRSGVTLMRFDQAHVHLTLHAGYVDGGTSGWTYGDAITPREVHKVIAAFDGGFKLNYGNVGFMSAGHVAATLKPGLASIVTYRDGTTGIGAWHAGVPRAGSPVYSVLQNQRLLVDRGTAPSNVSSCITDCWGATVGAESIVARSGLGITGSGELVWAAGERLTPAGLARALIAAGAVRALELDINLDWVAGYLYVHHSGGPSPVPVVPGQHGIAGELLQPDSRDFLAVIANL